ncbi:MAG: hypothetical protein MI976_00955 [Pseudomonadales bacterium]|nr:hypothetical protein [Pseudomonadales bacterium]
MALINTSSTNDLVLGIERLNATPTLKQLGRAPPKSFTTETETELLSGLGIAQKLLFSEKSKQPLSLQNANMGISFSQTADSALDQTVSAISELRALAVRATDDGLTEDEREELQEKADALIAEMNAVAESTVFAGKTLFDGSLDSINFAVGSDGDVVSLVSLRADASGLGLQPGELHTLGDRAKLVSNPSGQQGIQETDSELSGITDLKIKLENSQLSSRINIADTAYGGALKIIGDTDKLTDPLDDDFGAGIAKSAAERINSIRKSGQLEFKNLFARATTQFQSSDVEAADFNGTVNNSTSTSVKQGSLAVGDLTINGIQVGDTGFLDNDSANTLTNEINTIKEKTGVIAEINGDGELLLSAVDGRDIVVTTRNAEVTNILFGGGENRFNTAFQNLRITGRLALYSESELTFFGSGASVLGLTDFELGDSQTNKSVANNVSTIDLSTNSNASLALESVDEALAQVRNFKVSLQQLSEQFKASIDHIDISGANQNSISGVIANLSSSVLRGLSDTAVAAQDNINRETALFFLRN